jgi:hypothetical protein
MLEGFFIGFLVASACYALLSFLVPSAGQISKDKIKDVLDKAELLGSLKYRFKVIDGFTKEQLDLITHAERPSASAAHSKHKNQIISRLKELEGRKAEVMQSILDDGLDPVITMQTPEGPKNIKMSEALQLQKSAESMPAKSDPINPRKSSVSHLRLVKNEDNNDTSPPKVP